MKLKDVVKVVPAAHDTTKEAGKIIKVIVGILLASVITTMIIIYIKELI